MVPSAIVLTAAGSLLTLLALSAFVFNRMLRPGTSNVVATGNSPLNLAPMERLLASDDFEFLKRQPGFRPEMLTHLRSKRASLFQSYLNGVELEFHRLHSQLRLLVLESGIDNPVISRTLVEQRMLFSVRMVQVRFRLMLFRVGFQGFQTNGLVDVILQLREQVSQLQVAMPGVAPTAA